MNSRNVGISEVLNFKEMEIFNYNIGLQGQTLSCPSDDLHSGWGHKTYMWLYVGTVLSFGLLIVMVSMSPNSSLAHK